MIIFSASRHDSLPITYQVVEQSYWSWCRAFHLVGLLCDCKTGRKLQLGQKVTPKKRRKKGGVATGEVQVLRYHFFSLSRPPPPSIIKGYLLAYTTNPIPPPHPIDYVIFGKSLIKYLWSLSWTLGLTIFFCNWAIFGALLGKTSLLRCKLHFSL